MVQKIKRGFIKRLKAWGFKNSLKVYNFGENCCQIDEAFCLEEIFNKENNILPFIEVQNPRNANLLMVRGIITPLVLHNLIKVYEDMPDPKIVVVVGSCASSGGNYYNSYNVITNLDDYIPIDYYLIGCPPGDEAYKKMLNEINIIAMEKC